jgi:diaminopimelate epimerase
MRINFTKMQGAGNDFVVVDAINQNVVLTAEQIRFIADRHFGVGCDQLLLIEKTDRNDAEFRYRIFNADGIEVEQCGNGARCFARYVVERKMTASRVIPVETAGGLIQLQLEDDGFVSVDMGVPDFWPESLPFEATGTPEYHELKLNGEKYAIGAVSIGNPHAVLLVDSVDEAPIEALGPSIESHQRFPQRVNVGFMEVVDRHHIRLRVYERGVGETLACGSGACAAVAVGIRNRLLDEAVQVELRGGSLTISWPGEGSSIFMTGPAETVYEGHITL